MSEISTRPYLVRAIHEWCTDNGFTPYIVVRVDQYTRVPKQFVHEGRILFNISHEATSTLKMANDEITFKARFGGISQDIQIPVNNVLMIYASENGEGMAFEAIEKLTEKTNSPPDFDPEPTKKSKRPTLTRVK